MLKIKNEWLAYCLDESIWWFGKWVENEVKEAGKSTGKNDTEKRQTHRAEARFNAIMGLKPKFRNTTPTSR